MANKAATPASSQKDVQNLQSEVEYRTKLQDICNKIYAAKNLDEILINLKDEITSLFEAERITVYVVDGDKPVQLRATRAGSVPSAVNWAGSKGVIAATLRICGDGEDSLTNTDVAVETALTFLANTTLKLTPRE